MSEKHTYADGKSLQLHKNTISIIKREHFHNKKEVYQAFIGDTEDRDKCILKIFPQTSPELKNSIYLYAVDTMEYFIQMRGNPDTIDGKTHLLFKYYEQGSLSRYIQNENLSATEKHALIKNILEIGCYLHTKNYLHCDIKPDNFFMDNHKARLGDLESIHKLEDIHISNIDSLLGTKGFKYNQYENYDIKDEIFAYIATIYFIETAKTLLTPEEVEKIDMGENPIDAINYFVSLKIKAMEDDNVKNFLQTALNDLETDRKVDCCTLLTEFKTLLDQEIVTDTPPQLPPIKGEIDDELTILEKTKAFMGKFKIPLLGTGVLVIGAIVFYNQKEPTPPTDKNDTRVSTIIPHGPISPDVAQGEVKPIDTPVVEESAVSEEIPPILPSAESQTTTIVQKPTIPSPVVSQQEMPSKPEKIVAKPKVSQLAKNIASYRIVDENVLAVDVKEDIKVGKSLNIRITSHKDGYLHLLFIDTVDQIQIMKPRLMTSNTLFSISDHTIPIQTTKPTGLHYVVVIFAAKKYEFTPKNYLKIIKSFEDQAYGNEYVNIFPINIHP